MPCSFMLCGHNTRNLLASAQVGLTGIIPEGKQGQSALGAAAHSFVSERQNGVTRGNCTVEPGNSSRLAVLNVGLRRRPPMCCRCLTALPAGCLHQTHHLCHLSCCSYSPDNWLEICAAHLLVAPNAAICGDAQLFPFRQ